MWSRSTSGDHGTVKWFNPTKGYGFIQPQGGGKDVFVHISAVEKAGLTSLNEGQSIEYEEVSNQGKTSAANLKVQRWEEFVRQVVWSLYRNRHGPGGLRADTRGWSTKRPRRRSNFRRTVRW
jgi:cold shock protein